MQDTSSFYQDIAPVFLFTNENVAGTLRAIGNIRGADVLTVAGSGDHAFEAYLAGAKNVETFDLNILQEPIMELKTHMIKHLKYSDFMDFFFSKRDFFSDRILAPIYPLFSYKLHAFMDAYRTLGGDITLRYRNRATHENYRTDMISYVRDENMYNKLRDILSVPPGFHHLGLDNVAHGDIKKHRYDIILLSNLSEKLANCAAAPRDFLGFFNQYLFPICENNLRKRGGRICYSYIYGATNKAEDVNKFARSTILASDIANDVLNFCACPDFRVSGYCVDSSRRNVARDAILVLTQNVR